jgi:hypothetical protein
MDPVSIGVVTVGALAAAGGALYLTTRDGRTNGRFPTPNGAPAPLDMNVLASVIDRITIKNPSNATRPLHEVPIVGRVSTPWVDGFSPRDSISLSHPQQGVQTLAAVREMLHESGNADIDPRCYWYLIANECGPTGVHCWWRAVGNVKANWSLYGSRERMAQGYASVASPECTRLWVVQDRLMSRDIYFGYDNFADAVRHHVRVLSQPGYAGPNGVLESWRAGGLDGLIAGARALARGGYSPETQDVREVEARAFWSGRQRQMGDQWVR